MILLHAFFKLWVYSRQHIVKQLEKKSLCSFNKFKMAIDISMCKKIVWNNYDFFESAFKTFLMFIRDAFI